MSHFPVSLFLRFFCLVILLIFSAEFSFAQLSGNYTIDTSKSASSTNYKSFNSAISDLINGTRTDGGTANGKGVKGAVTFSVPDGVYAEQLTIRPVPGASATNKITFKSASGDSTKAIIAYGNDSLMINPFVLTLDSADYITFQGFTFQRTENSYYQVLINLQGFACFNRLLNNRFIGHSDYGSYLVTSSDSTEDSFNTFRYNYFLHGGEQLRSTGRNGYCETGLDISYNIFDSAHSSAISVANSCNFIIQNNRINYPHTNSYYALSVGQFNNGKIINNIIKSNTVYAVSLTYDFDTSKPTNNIFANNIISGGALYSLVNISSLRNITIANNTFYNTHFEPTSATLSLYIGDSMLKNELVLLNNHIIHAGQGVPLFIDRWTVQNKYIKTADYNNIYSFGKPLGDAKLASFNDTLYDDFSKYKSVSGYEKNGHSLNPEFLNLTNFLPQSPFLANKGFSISALKTDITNTTRDTLHPDIGAYETEFFSYDASLSLFKSDTGDCNNNVIVNLRNFGSQKIDSVSLKYQLSADSVKEKRYSIRLNSGSDTNIIIQDLVISDSLSSVTIYINSLVNASDLNKFNDTISLLSAAPMHGYYSVGSSGLYKDLTSAINDVTKRGICDSVFLQVEDGTYEEQLYITHINGAHKKRSVVIESKSQDTGKVIIRQNTKIKTGYGNVSSPICLYGAEGVVFRNITIEASTVPAVIVGGSARNNVFQNNHIKSPIGISETLNYDAENWYIENDFTCKETAYENKSYSNNQKSNIHLIGNRGLSTVISKVDSLDIIENTGTDFWIGSVEKHINFKQNKVKGGVEINYSNAKINFSKNKVDGFVHFNSCTDSNGRSIISNNMIWSDAPPQNHVQVSYCRNLDVFYNTIVSRKRASRTLYIGNSIGTKIFNNILNNKRDSATACVLYILTADDVDSCDYNCFYAESGNHIYYLGSAIWPYTYHVATGFDGHSVRYSPYFVANDDLHFYFDRGEINNFGRYIPGIEDDIDGDKRDTVNHDMGADEYNLPRAQLSIVKLLSPTNTIDCGTHPIKIQVKNNGIVTVDSVKIGVYIDEKLVKEKWHKLNLTIYMTADLFIDSINTADEFQHVKILASSPNNMPDSLTYDDTLSFKIKGRFKAGTYTLGDSTSDFKTFKAAIDTLKERGICGPVVFKVADGIYTEQPTFPKIEGASEKNTITFESASGDSTKVIITVPSEVKNYPNHIFYINGGEHYIFRRLTIQRTGKDSLGTAIKLSGSYNVFENNIIKGSKHQAVNYYGNSENYVIAGGGEKNKIINNIIKYGYTAIDLDYSDEDSISNNIIDSFQQIGIDIKYGGRTEISYNIIKNIPTKLSYSTGIKLNTCGGLKIIGNNTVTENLATGIYLQYFEDNGYKTLVSNNMISTSQYGISIWDCAAVDIINNTIAMYAKHNLGSLIISGSKSEKIALHNNIFANFGGGIVASFSHNKILKSSDNNVFYSPREAFDNFISYDKKNFYTVTDFSSATGFDYNSLRIDPAFISPDNLHTRNIELWKKGQSFAQVSKDFDKEIRKSVPDIGADELNLYKKDVQLLGWLNKNYICSDSLIKFSANIVNAGLDTLADSIQVVLVINNKDSFSAFYKGKLAPTATDLICIPTNITSTGKFLSACIYTSFSKDQHQNNDTLRGNFLPFTKPEISALNNPARCGAGNITMIANHNSNLPAKWYSTELSNTPIASGDTLTVTLNSSKTYYTAAYSYLPGSFYYDFHAQPKDLRLLYGSFFSVKAKTDLYIDSFAIHSKAIGSLKVDFFYKKGGYAGYESSSSGWTNGGTITVNANGHGKETYLPISALHIPQDSTYSFYVYTHSEQLIEDPENLTKSNEHLEVKSGSSSQYLFNSTFSSRHWNGAVFYRHASCESNRQTVKATINHNLSGIKILKGVDFDGYLSANNSTMQPDSVCTNSAFSYQLTPPDSFINKDYNTRWKLVNFIVETTGGRQFKDTVLISPTDSTNFIIKLRPNSALNDSILVLGWRTEDLKTGCYKDYQRSVYLKPVPKSIFYADDICVGEKLIIRDSTKSIKKLKYLYTYSDGTYSTQANPIKVFSKAGNYIITQKVMYYNGCADSSSKKITVLDIPKAGFAFDSTICVQTATLFRSDILPENKNIQFKWNFGDGKTDTGRNVTHIYSNAGKYFVTLNMVNQSGCVDSVTNTIEVLQLPAASFNASNVCENDSVSFTNTSTNAISYLWNFGNGNFSAKTNIKHLFAGAGRKRISLIVKSASGCIDSISNDIEIYTNPSPDFISKDVCIADSAYFKNLTPVINTTIYWHWDFGDGKTSTLQKPAHKYDTPGNYKVILIAKTSTGCVGEISKTINVNANPQAAFSAGNICEDDTLTFINNSIYGSSYTWDFGDGKFSTDINPTHIFTRGGKFTVTLYAQSTTGCMDTTSKEINVYFKPATNFSAGDVCLGDTTYFKDLTPNSDSAIQWLWIFGDGDSSTQEHPYHKYRSAGNFKVYLFAKTKNGCVDTLSKTVNVHALPDISFIANSKNLEAQFIPSDTTFKSYFWSFGDDETSFSHSPKHTYSGEGIYYTKLTVEDKNGCINSYADSVLIDINSVSKQEKTQSGFSIYPNPFNNSTTINYNLQKAEFVRLFLYDIYGKEIALLDNKFISNGKYAFTLKAKDLELTAGIYIIRLQAGSTILNTKVIFTK